MSAATPRVAHLHFAFTLARILVAAAMVAMNAGCGVRHQGAATKPGASSAVRFVAVPLDSDQAAYSTDGITWRPAALPSRQYWACVAHGAGKFVALADSTTAAYSLDGIRWIPSPLPISARWDSVAYGTGGFLAVAWASNEAIRSVDGITWTVVKLPSSDAPTHGWESVTAGNGLFVAVDGRNQATWSPDGVQWHIQRLPIPALGWIRVSYGNGVFVATDGTQAAYSRDGIVWKTAPLGGTGHWHGLTFGNGRFLAVAYARNQVASSHDGIHWRIDNLPADTPYWSIPAASNGVLVVGPAPGNRAAHSADGIHWFTTSLPLSAFWHVASADKP
jgi:hypothetical protein